MKGRAKFAAASGKEQDERLVRADYNTAKTVGNLRYGKDYIFYHSITKWLYVEYNDIVWAYRRLEDVQGKLCSGTAAFEVHSLMIVTKNKDRIGMPVGDREYALEGLNIIREHNKFADIGYSKEKEEKYL